MNWHRAEGNFKQFKGSARARWGKLTGNQLHVLAGQRDMQAGKIEEAYGVAKEATEKQLSDWRKRLKTNKGARLLPPYTSN